MSKESTSAAPLSGKQIMWLLVSIAVYVILRLIPMQGLSVEGQSALAATAWVIVALISECLPTMLTNMIFAAIVVLSGVLPVGGFLAAFGTSPFMLVLCLGTVAMGMEKTNLGARIAYTVIKYVGKTPSLLVLAIMLTGTTVSALVVNLPALLAICPIVLSILKELNEKQGESNLGKAMFLGLIWSAGAGGLALLSGSALNSAGVATIEAATNGAETITYIQWATIGIPIALIMVISGWLFLSKWFKVNKTSKSLPKEVVNERLKELGIMKGDEIRYLLLLILMILTFIFGEKYQLTPPVIAIIFMALILMPKIGFIKWEEVQQRTNWAMLFQIGFFVGFAGAIVETGLGEWMSNMLFSGFAQSNLFVMIIVTCLLGHISAFLIPGGGAAIMLIPSVVAFSGNAGITGVVLPLLLYHVSQWSQLQPIQPQYLVVCSNADNYLQIRDFVVPNIAITVVWTLLLCLAFYFLAPLLGLV